MAASSIIEEDQGTYTRSAHPQHGYRAADFSSLHGAGHFGPGYSRRTLATATSTLPAFHPRSSQFR